MSRRAQLSLLCEDKQQQVFAYRTLRGWGYERHKLRLLPLPSGSGAGEQYVRKQYPREVKACRQQANYHQVGLLTFIDADTTTVDFRHQQLNDALTENALEPRLPPECIAILVSKRNVETWIHFLFGEEVDEETEYPKLKNESHCEEAVKKLIEYLRGEFPDDSPPSLLQGGEELKERLLQ